MSAYKKLFQQTFIYGLATMLPRMLNFLLVPLYTDVFKESDYGNISFVFSYVVIFNIILSYGMETAFFRFFTKEKNHQQVKNTSAWSLVISSTFFLVLLLINQQSISLLTDIPVDIIQLVCGILFFDALCVIPFAFLRAEEKPMRFAVIKILNVALNLGLNIFFLVYFKKLIISFPALSDYYQSERLIYYVFLSIFIASAFTLILMLPFYRKLELQFDTALIKKMLRYSWPVLLAGLAFSVNETLDKILLNYLLPESIAEAEVGKYAACYKLAMFMTLFATAFRMGIEPFFFKQATTKNPQQTYAQITKYFVMAGCLILLFVMINIDWLKTLLIRREGYYEALNIVPIVLLANLCLGIYHNLSVWYKVTDRTYFGAIISCVGAVLTLLINFIFIPVYGYYASAVATLVAYASMVIMSYSLGRRYYKIPYASGKILGYILVTIAFTAIHFYYLDGHLLWGIGIFLILGLIFYIFERQEINQIILQKNN
ncbi:MAG: oligosaccharide flippase family protein [Psychroflexus sp.]|nr:oligosaccharide flippase family protein [Psychroflexus sp.]MDR9447972.1 oligosaccharide flippase family protein [Psychroflexus sp.]